MIVLVNRPGRCKGDRQQTGAHRRSKNLRKNLPGSGVCGWRTESSRRAPIKNMGRHFVVPATYPLMKLSFCAYGVGALRVGGGFLTAPGLLTLSVMDINRTGNAAATSPGHSVSCSYKCPFLETYFHFFRRIFS